MNGRDTTSWVPTQNEGGGDEPEKGTGWMRLERRQKRTRNTHDKRIQEVEDV
jgi:hypothetical protein